MKSSIPNSQFKNPVINWIDTRLPIFTAMNEAVGTEHPTPKNLNYWWNFGSLAGVTLVIMIITGIALAMNYTAHVDHAFDSVERIMRDVNGGWLIRYIHMNGASFFFIVVYIHMARSLYYGSYKAPRELLWILGVVIYLLMMATAFLGYTLPWGQMSFWGATVITNFFSVIPFVGEPIVNWLLGGYTVDNPTLNRFYALHYLLPFVIAGVILLHIVALHRFGSNNPLGLDASVDKMSFYPYCFVKDLVAWVSFGVFFSVFVYFAPNFLGHPDNYIPANPMSTPAHIVPEWYFLWVYAILRSIPNKLGGVAAIGLVFACLLALPFLQTSEVRSSLFRPIHKKLFWLLLADCLILGWIGMKPVETPYVEVGQIASVYFFVHFLVFVPILGRLEAKYSRSLAS